MIDTLLKEVYGKQKYVLGIKKKLLQKVQFTKDLKGCHTHLVTDHKQQKK